MPSEKQSSFIKVDDLMPKVAVEQALAYYGVANVELHRHETRGEIRSRCFLNCGRQGETNDRALCIEANHPGKPWKCFQSGCGKGGNLVSLCDLMKPGENAKGKPRGERFKAIAADLQAMTEGQTLPAAPTAPISPGTPALVANVPLERSDNSRARALTNLDAKFVRDPALLPPAVSRHLRVRPWMTEELLRQWRVGYLPRDGGDDKSGGTMRGHIVYPWLTEQGELLTWFGLDSEFAEKHNKWESSDRSDPEPMQWRFVKGFQRGLELFGQHQLHAEGVKEKLSGIGLPLVEDPDEVLRFAALGVPAVGLCGDRVTREQADKAAKLAREVAGGVVTVLLPCTAEGEVGMKQALGYLSQLTAVRLGWSPKMYSGAFQGCSVDSLTQEEWQMVEQFLRTGERDWSLG